MVFDALNTQKQRIEYIVENKGYYVAPVKGNQGSLEENIKLYCEDEKLFKISKEKIYYFVKEKLYVTVKKRIYLSIYYFGGITLSIIVVISFHSSLVVGSPKKGIDKLGS